jgi:hypothetical protein
MVSVLDRQSTIGGVDVDVKTLEATAVLFTD